MAVIDVALVTGERAVPERNREEDLALVDALERRGLVARIVSWKDPGFDWAGARRVLVRSAFDWTHELRAFRAWAEAVTSVTSLSPTRELIDRFARKLYLYELGSQGIPHVRTAFLKKGWAGRLEQLVSDLECAEVVLKPMVGIASNRVRRVGPGNMADGEAAFSRMIARGSVVVQPFIRSIQTEGEISVVVLGGEIHHVVRRIPAAGDFRAHLMYGGLDEAIEIPPRLGRLARRVIASVGPGAFAQRLDFFRLESGDFRLTEVEIISPSLYLDQAPAGVERLADVLARDLGHSGSPARSRPTLPGPAGVVVRPLRGGSTLPVEVTPAVHPGSPRYLADWVRENRDYMEAKLLEHGAVLLRGFGLSSAEDFRHLVQILDDTMIDYQGGISARDEVIARVYESTHYRHDLAIELHNELSHTTAWPAKILFFCRVPPPFGGQTPIADGRALLAAIPEATRARFRARGLRYRWIYPDRATPVRVEATSWQKAFRTEERGEVEAACAAAGLSCEWREDGAVETTSVRDAILAHPVTGEEVWFNQADVRSAIRDRGMHRVMTTFADGEPFLEEDLAAIRAASESVSSIFPWQRGDLLILDNVLALHGRRPYHGPRDILVAMCRGRSPGSS